MAKYKNPFVSCIIIFSQALLNNALRVGLQHNPILHLAGHKSFTGFFLNFHSGLFFSFFTRILKSSDFRSFLDFEPIQSLAFFWYKIHCRNNFSLPKSDLLVIIVFLNFFRPQNGRPKSSLYAS